MLSLKDYIKEIQLVESDQFIVESMELLNENADAMGKYHELMYAWHANGGKFAKEDPRKADAEKIKADLESKLDQKTKEAISAKAKKSADEVNKMISDNGHKHVGTFWTSKPGDIKKVTGIDQSQHENASDVIHRIVDEHGNVKHLGISLKHLGSSAGHAPTSNPGINQLDTALGTNSQHHIDAANRKIDAEFPEHAGKSMKEKKAIAKADPKYYEASFEHKRKAVEKIRDAHIAAFNGMNHDAQVAHLRSMMHAHDTPDVPQLVVTSHSKGTRIENRAQRYHPSNIKSVETTPSGWNTIKHTIHFKDGTHEQWQARGKFESGPHSSLKGSFERTK